MISTLLDRPWGERYNAGALGQGHVGLCHQEWVLQYVVVLHRGVSDGTGHYTPMLIALVTQSCALLELYFSLISVHFCATPCRHHLLCEYILEFGSLSFSFENQACSCINPTSCHVVFGLYRVIQKYLQSRGIMSPS